MNLNWLDNFPGGRKLRAFLTLLFGPFDQFELSLPSVFGVLLSVYGFIFYNTNPSIDRFHNELAKYNSKQIIQASASELSQTSGFIIELLMTYGFITTVILFGITPVFSFIVTFVFRDSRTASWKKIFLAHLLLFSRLMLISLLLPYFFVIIFGPEIVASKSFIINWLLATMLFNIVIYQFKDYMFQFVIQEEYGRVRMITRFVLLLLVTISIVNFKMVADSMYLHRRALIVASIKYPSTSIDITELHNFLTYDQCDNLKDYFESIKIHPPLLTEERFELERNKCLKDMEITNLFPESLFVKK